MAELERSGRIRPGAREERLALVVDVLFATGDGETVLIVGDGATVRMLVSEVLSDLGYNALGAEDGAAELKLVVSGTRIDLLITDVELPGGLNSRQVTDAARASVLN